MNAATPSPQKPRPKTAAEWFRERPVLFRCDGSPDIGLGHVTRCLTLASAFAAAGISSISFLTRSYSEHVTRKIEKAGYGLDLLPSEATMERDLQWTLSHARDLAQRGPKPLVVTDSHDFPAEYYVELKRAGLDVFSIDDYAGVEYASDFVLNHNLTASDYHYKVKPYTRLLLGPDYLPLREEFRRQQKNRKRNSPEVANIVLSLGGMPLVEDYRRVLRGIQLFQTQSRKLQVTAVLGLQDNGKADCLSDLRAGARVALDGEDLGQLFADADIAIVNAGVTSYEAASLALPLIMGSAGTNQDDTLESFASHQACLPLGPLSKVTPEAVAGAIRKLDEGPNLRQAMADRAGSLVDGHGVERIVNELSEALSPCS